MGETRRPAADAGPVAAARRRTALVAGLLAIALGAGAAAGAAEPAAPRLSLGLLLYLSAQRLESDAGSSTDLLLKRGHVDLVLDLDAGFSARVTPDVTVDGEGDVEAPVKFALVRWTGQRWGPILRPSLAAGRVPTPWIGYEESIYRYRMQDGTFMDRLGFFASADEGLVAEGQLGEPLPEEVLEGIGRGSPGRWGSFAVGGYSGSGFKAADEYGSAVFEGRLSLRPLPELLPEVQLSGLVVRGEGNTPDGPEWRVDALMASWQRRRTVATLQATDSVGTQGGGWVDARGEALPGRGWSAFLEVRQSAEAGWAAFGRYDRFDRDREHAGGELRRSILGVARHFSRGSAVLLDVERLEEEGVDDSWRFQLTLQARPGPWRLASRG